MKEKYYWLLFGILGTTYLFLTASLPTARQNMAIFNLQVASTGISYALAVLKGIKIAESEET